MDIQNLPKLNEINYNHDLNYPECFIGTWSADGKKSDSIDPFLKEQGISWVKRKAVNVAQNIMKQEIKFDDDFMKLIFTMNTPLGIKNEENLLDGTVQDCPEDPIGFGPSTSQNIWLDDNKCVLYHFKDFPRGKVSSIRYLENQDQMNLEIHWVNHKTNKTLDLIRVFKRD
eukprot:TRINITY_DN3670_c0_g1_i1.p1 TRINITY_DN3670_c0_g1~~TRINITY_DN3670_c0_g1_i1.p1  ORF type:complete len:171 (-),score=45.78 TRINITY_DN3670_c0_g1_i1:191-703(-)